MTTKPPTQSLRAGLKRRLPKLLRKAAGDYAAFAAAAPPADAKGFAGHQAACKAALAHLDAGLKLLAWAEDAGAAATPPDDDIDRLIHRARAVLAAADEDEDGSRIPSPGS